MNNTSSAVDPKIRLKELLLRYPDLPVYTTNEIRLGTHLGSGAYADVHDIRSLKIGTIKKKEAIPAAVVTANEDDIGVIEDKRQKARERLSKEFSSTTNGINRDKDYYQLRTAPIDYANNPELKPPPRLVLKRLKSSYWFGQGQLSKQGQHDILNEIQILLELNSESQKFKSSSNAGSHPNIIGLHGIMYDDNYAENKTTTIGSSSVSCCPYPSFILTRLHSTLSNQMNKWRSERGFGWQEIYAFRRNSGNAANSPFHERWIERIIILSQIASALQFMHDKQIVYRDVKPDNIGLDLDRVTKLFDFGLAKSLTDLTPTTGRISFPTSSSSSTTTTSSRGSEVISSSLSSSSTAPQTNNFTTPQKNKTSYSFTPTSDRTTTDIAANPSTTSIFSTKSPTSSDDIPSLEGVNLIDKDTKNSFFYKLTGETGTPRYMAPEVAFGPYAYYGCSADIFSLSILFHEVLSLKVPYANVTKYRTISEFMDAIRDEGLRPHMETIWPVKIKDLIASMWNGDPKCRPTAGEVKTQLDNILRGPSHELFPCSAENNNKTPLTKKLSSFFTP